MNKEKSSNIFNSGIWTFVAIIVSILITFLATSFSIDNRIEKYVNNPQFVKKLALETRLPFMIFDEKGIIHFDGGAFTYIDTIKVNTNKKHELVSIDIFPREFFNTPPILECLGFEIQFYDPVRIAPNGWRYSEPENAVDFLTSSGTQLATKFKITLILNN